MNSIDLLFVKHNHMLSALIYYLNYPIWTVHPKVKILSPFTDPHVIPNLPKLIPYAKHKIIATLAQPIA